MLLRKSPPAYYEREWRRWLLKRPKRPQLLYHLTTERNVPSIERYGLRVSKSKDLGTGVYFFGGVDSAEEMAFENEVHRPVILVVRTDARFLHASDVYRRSGKAPWAGYEHLGHLRDMWIVRRSFVPRIVSVRPLT